MERKKTMAKIPLQAGNGRYELLASRFEAELLPLKDPAEAEEILSSFKLRHPKADHYPYAYRVDKEEKETDDGEPGGSAGKPMLILLEGEDIGNAILLVARYFGGTKLGVGRLRRSFLAAATEALKNAAYGAEKAYSVYRLSLSYSRFEEIKRLSKKHGLSLENPQYGLSVEVSLPIDGTIPLSPKDLGISEAEILSEKEEIRIVEAEDGSK